MIAVQYLMDKVHLRMSPEKEDKVIGVLPFFREFFIFQGVVIGHLLGD